MIYYSLDKKALGPVPVERLHDLFRRGVVGVDTLIRAEGSRNWTTYRSHFLPIPQTWEPAWVPADPLANSADSRVRMGKAPSSEYSGMVKAGWILLGLTTFLAFIPVFGFGTWLVGGMIALVTITLAIIILARGGTRDGILLLMVTFFVFPVAVFLGPLVSTLSVAAAAAGSNSEPHGALDPRFPFDLIPPAQQPKH